MRPHLYVIVPVFNEAANVPRLVASCRAIAAQLESHDVSFLMIDDGSSDGTAALAREAASDLSLDVLAHASNQGPGAAFATAFAHLAPRVTDGDLVATIEGDNTSRLELLQQMIVRSREGFDVVLASPYLYGGGILNTSPWRTFLSHVANVVVKEALGIRGIMTVSSFYRLYRGDALRRLQACYGPGIVERRGFECMIELLMKLVYLKATISEVAMPLDSSRRSGASKMRVLPTAIGYLTLWLDKGRWIDAAARCPVAELAGA